MAAEHEGAEGETYIIADNRAPTLNHIVETLAEAQGVRPPRWHGPVPAPLCRVRRVRGRLQALWYIATPAPPAAAWLRSRRSFDVTKARSELGFEPRVAPEQGPREMVASYQEAGWLP